jgi:DNA-binding CsgD family transcriptional regulator
VSSVAPVLAQAPYPATARLRAELLLVEDAEALVALFADALAEHGISGHFCLERFGGDLVPVLGDSPELIRQGAVAIVLDCQSGARVLLAMPSHPLTREQAARVRGYAELYAARALALREWADDVETACGLSLRERYVLGRFLTGMAPVDIAAEAKLSVATVGASLDAAAERLGMGSVADAASVAARRGWLTVTSLVNCSSTFPEIAYKMAKNG